jgi:hypothetical protein
MSSPSKMGKGNTDEGCANFVVIFAAYCEFLKLEHARYYWNPSPSQF